MIIVLLKIFIAMTLQLLGKGSSSRIWFNRT